MGEHFLVKWTPWWNQVLMKFWWAQHPSLSLRNRHQNLNTLQSLIATAVCLPGSCANFYLRTYNRSNFSVLNLVVNNDIMLQIAGFHCHTIIKTIQYVKSRIKETKEDEYSNSLAKVQVCAMFRVGDIRRNVLLKFIRLCTETPCLCPSQGHKYGGRKLTKTCIIEFCYKKPVVVFWGLINREWGSFSVVGHMLVRSSLSQDSMRGSLVCKHVIIMFTF